MPGSLPGLLVRDASGNEREVQIARVPFTMGRQSDNDLVLMDSRISRHHAKIFQDDRGYLIEDAASRHGTFVNNDRITCCPLKSGDHVSLGVTDAYQLTFVDSALQLTDAERGMLFLVHESGELRLRLARGRGGVYLHSGLDDYSHAALERVVASGREEVSLEEVSGRTTNETALIHGGERSLVAVPLQKHPMMEMTGETVKATAPELLGVLYLDSNSRATSLTSLDREVLRTFAVEGATVIENARLFRLTREQERIRHEFGLARDIQQGLLPRELPKSDFFEIQAVTMRCEAVGGDYYDVIRLPGERYGLAVADVSGKGLPAAILAATLQGAFAAVAAGDPGLEELFSRVNDFLCERTPPQMFATLFTVWWTASGDLILLTLVTLHHSWLAPVAR